jgi:hypothetical protein
VATWQDFERDAPDLARRVRARFDAHKHKMLATLRADGSPRLSGIETRFHRGELWLGMMAMSRKAMDLRRDPRLALHSATVDPDLGAPDGTGGDARVSGRAEEVFDAELFVEVVRSGEPGPDEPGDDRPGEQAGDGEPVPETDSHLFRIDVSEVVLIGIGDPPDHLVIETWREGRGARRTSRY